jgi:hypothetical protein
VRSASSLARLCFCFAVAITAAAVADPLVESLSNAGVFGPGRFTDRSNAAMLPALSVGFLFAALFVFVLARRGLAGQGTVQRWLRISEAALSPTTVFGLFPATFALQIAALFTMETAEQRVILGHTLGGTVWLGGPVLISLAFHVIVGMIVAALFVRLLHWLAQSVAEAIAFLRLVLVWAALTPAAPMQLGWERPRRSDEPALSRPHDRGPPHLCF